MLMLLATSNGQRSSKDVMTGTWLYDMMDWQIMNTDAIE